MKRGLTSLAAVAAAALALAACGDDDDNDDDVTIPDLGELTVPDISIPDVSLPDTLPGGITIPDISIPNLTMPELSVGERVEDLIRQTFPDLSDEQVSCLLDVTEGEVPSTDLLQQIAETCDISLQDLIPG